MSRSGRSIIETRHRERKIIVISQLQLIYITNIASQDISPLTARHHFTIAHIEVGKDHLVLLHILQLRGMSDTYNLAISTSQHIAIVHAKKSLLGKSNITKPIFRYISPNTERPLFIGRYDNMHQSLMGSHP